MCVKMMTCLNKHSTLNFQLSTLNSQPATLNPHASGMPTASFVHVVERRLRVWLGRNWRKAAPIAMGGCWTKDFGDVCMYCSKPIEGKVVKVGKTKKCY